MEKKTPFRVVCRRYGRDEKRAPDVDVFDATAATRTVDVESESGTKRAIEDSGLFDPTFDRFCTRA